MRADHNPLAVWLPRLRNRRVVVLGDLVVDEFIYGEMKRVYGDVARTSREVAFGLLLRQQQVDRRPGGGANAVNNLLALGAKPIPFGFVGNDEAGRWLRSYFRRHGCEVGGIRVVRSWTTPTKARILAGSAHSAAQQVLRLDREQTESPAAGERRQLVAAARRALRRADAVLISDYGYGAAEPAAVRSLLAGRRKLPAVLDSRYRIREYRGATALTPSVPELEEAYHCRLASGSELIRCARRLLREVRADSVLLTRGRQGMLLLTGNTKPLDIPIVGTDQVADVTGAGDTVAAAFTAALAAGADFAAAAHLANLAAGRAVLKRGTATVPVRELEEVLRSTDSQEKRPTRSARD